ncbi:transposase, partial [uncultured Jannaschia sp.]|uniref:transposase n=1 Tax=uncultured Jannaschia sp. TaxID=293347 RepID=UPI002614B3C4
MREAEEDELPAPGEVSLGHGAARKDTDSRWTVKYSKTKARTDGSKPVDIAIPIYGYRSHVSIDRMHGVIRRQIVTDAAQHDGARLRGGLIQTANTARGVWADSAYRSAENGRWLEAHGMTSQVHRKKPRGCPPLVLCISQLPVYFGSGHADCACSRG